MKINKKILALCCSVLVIVAAGIGTIKQANTHIDYSGISYLEISDQQKLEVFRLLESKRYSENHILEYADLLIDGYLVTNDNDIGDILFDIDNIDWDMQETASPNTFSLYLHSLNSAYYLLETYVSTGEEEYYATADKFIRSWVDYLHAPGKKNAYVWYDHAAALRTETLIYYAVIQELTQSKGTEQWLNEEITSHAEWLMDDSNYYAKHNHGIFQDGALIKCGYYLNREDCLEKGIARLDEQLKYAFPNKLAHIENSSGYSIGTLDLLLSISDFLASLENPFAEEISGYRSGAFEFLTYSVMPNNNMASYGDTLGRPSSSSITTGSIYTMLESYGQENGSIEANLKYAITSGQKGNMPPDKTKVFLADGYAFFRESWEKDSFVDSTWVMFKSGFLSTTHKHKDDLSFFLYSKGREIFIDPGMYNYMVGNVYHDYINDNTAHNTVIVDDMPYPIATNLTEKAGLLEYHKDDNYEMVSGYNNLYNGVWIDRSFIYVNENEFYIIDDILSDENHEYSQNFHLSNYVRLTEHNNEYSILKIENTEWNVVVQQLEKVDGVSQKTGDTGDYKTMSVMSNGFNKLEDTTSIQYHKAGQNVQFITSIKIVTDHELQDTLANKAALQDNLLITDRFLIDTASRIRATPTHVAVEIKDDVLYVDNKENEAKGLLSCYYLYGKDSSEILDKSSYSKNGNAEFKLSYGASYALISYSCTDSGQKVSWLSGYLYPEGKSFVFEPVKPEESIPYINGKTMTKNSDGSYSFVFEPSGFTNMLVKWYIYHDGSGYDYYQGNGNRLDFRFTEPGKYTCIYRISDNYFYEVEHGNFPEITVE